MGEGLERGATQAVSNNISNSKVVVQHASHGAFNVL